MTYRIAYFGSMILAVCVIILNGCVGSSKPSEFFLLRSLPASQDTALNASENSSPSVLVGPVTLPAYLNRNQIVTLAGDHKMVLNEFTRWAEPLQDNFSRVLVENLGILAHDASQSNRGVREKIEFDRELAGYQALQSQLSPKSALDHPLQERANVLISLPYNLHAARIDFNNNGNVDLEIVYVVIDDNTADRTDVYALKQHRRPLTQAFYRLFKKHDEFHCFLEYISTADNDHGTDQHDNGTDHKSADNRFIYLFGHNALTPVNVFSAFSN